MLDVIVFYVKLYILTESWEKIFPINQLWDFYDFKIVSLKLLWR